MMGNGKQNDDTSTERATVLMIDDDASLRRVLRRILEPKYECFEASCLSEAAAMLAARNFSVVLLDVSLPDGSGLDWLDRHLADVGDAAVVVLSGNSPAEVAPRAIGGGAIGHLLKPCRVSDVRSQMLAAVAIRERLKMHRRALDERVGSGVFRSADVDEAVTLHADGTSGRNAT